MEISVFLLPILFVLFSTFCSIVFGKSLQIRTNYNFNSISGTLVLGIPLYLISAMIAMIPTILINLTLETMSNYFYAIIAVLFSVAVGLIIYNRKLFKWKFIEIAGVFFVTIITSLILIFANQQIDFNESERILFNLKDSSLLGDNFILNDYSFGWARYLSLWVSLFQTSDIEVVNGLLRFGVFIFFALFLTSTVYAIASDILKWEDKIKNSIAPFLVIGAASIFAIVKLNIVSGILIPLLVLLTILVLFFYTMNNVVKREGIKLFMGSMFFLAFLLDYNTWGICIALMIALTLYQGYRLRAFNLKDFLIWYLVNMLNVIIIYSNEIIASIILLMVTGIITLFLIRYLAGNSYARRFKLEYRMWRYELGIVLFSFILMVGASLLVSEFTQGNSISLWLKDDFWSMPALNGDLQRRLVLGLLGILVLFISFYSFYFFWYRPKQEKNLLMLIVIFYVMFFFNPLITPIFNVAATKRLYGFGFVFIITLLVITILNFFKEIKIFKETKFLTLFPILIALTLFLVGTFVYKDFFLLKGFVRRKQIYHLKTGYYGNKKRYWN